MDLNFKRSRYFRVDTKLRFQQLRLLFEVLDKYDMLQNNLIIDGKGYKQSSFKVTVPEIGTFTCVKNKSTIDIKLETPTSTQGLSFEMIGSFFKEINLDLQKCEKELWNFDGILCEKEESLEKEKAQDMAAFQQRQKDLRVEKSEIEKKALECKARMKRISKRIQLIRQDVLFNKKLIYTLIMIVLGFVALSIYRIIN